MQVAAAPSRPTTLVTRIQTRLEGIGTPLMWRALLAFLSGLLTFVVTTGGLFILLPWVQSAIIAGIVVGLTSPKIRTSAIIGALVGLLGSLCGPEHFYNFLFNFAPARPALSVPLILGAAAVCGVVAVGATLLRDRFEGATATLVAAAIVVLIVNLWFTPITLNDVSSTRAGSLPLNAFNDQLDGYLDDALVESDGALFLYVLMEMENGRGFYDAYSTVLTNIRGGTQTLADFRTPVIWWLWSALPNRQSIVIAWLVLSTMAILAAARLGMSAVKAPLVIPGVAALTAYLGYFAFNLELLRQDPWAGALAVLALAAMGLSVRSQRWRTWTVATVALTVLSLLTREIMALLLVAGFTSALFGDKSQRRFRLTAWIAGVLAFGGLYGLHAATAQPYINLASEGMPRVGYGNVPFMLAAFDFGTSFLGRHGWLPVVLGALGVVGIFMIRDSRLRAYALIATLGSLGAFLVIGNNAWVVIPGVTEKAMVNYWGVAVVPLVYAAIPFVFSVFPHSLVAEPAEYRDEAQTESPASEELDADLVAEDAIRSADRTNVLRND